MLERVGANLDAVEFFQRETDRVWTRDYCPLFVKNGARRNRADRVALQRLGEVRRLAARRRRSGVPRRSG